MRKFPKSNLVRGSKLTSKDQAAIQHAVASEQCPSVQYNILHSQSYQVPVLYFHYHHSVKAHNGLDLVYEALVAKNEQSELRSVGVLGAISMGVGKAFL